MCVFRTDSIHSEKCGENSPGRSPRPAPDKILFSRPASAALARPSFCLTVQTIPPSPPFMDTALLPAQLLFTGALAGLCWTVQLAVYALFPPLIGTMDAAAFRAHHAAYTRAMGWVAAPLMLIELALALAWTTTDAVFARTGLGLVAAIWLLTFAFIVPVHARLQAAPAADDARRLAHLNWLRTALWTARAALLAFVVIRG
jgi:hypothetical protein